jgi:NTE family protein
MKKNSLLLICSCYLFAHSASTQPYRNLVFEGAGIRGIAYVGAIKVLEEKNILTTIDKIGGTSAGAIAALAVALGYNSGEIEKLIYDMKLQKFNDGRFLFFGGISRVNRNYGWYRGKAFTTWLEKIIFAKTGDADITFQQFKERHFKDLYVTGTSLNQQQLLVFSNESYPDMKVKDAVRISMSIPLYFEAVFIDSTGHVIDKEYASGYYHIMVDGGIMGNFPIFIFDKHSVENGRANRVADPSTLGLRIDTPEQIDYDTRQKGIAPIPIYHFKNYMSAFYNYAIENLNRRTLTAEDWKRTVSISSGHIGPKIRKLSLAEKNTLITNGHDAMENFLNKSMNAK